ncbi:MAG: autotransporter domain-containing protein [Alphaproteobacteria bacterium]|nr:autotransporter domain-containing protein [Alphaproteobacteria bacterium]
MIFFKFLWQRSLIPSLALIFIGFNDFAQGMNRGDFYPDQGSIYNVNLGKVNVGDTFRIRGGDKRFRLENTFWAKMQQGDAYLCKFNSSLTKNYKDNNAPDACVADDFNPAIKILGGFECEEESFFGLTVARWCRGLDLLAEKASPQRVANVKTANNDLLSFEGHEYDITYTVGNNPTANITSPSRVALSQNFNVSSSSTDPDGDALTCQWRQLSGPSAEIINPTSCTTNMIAPASSALETLGIGEANIKIGLIVNDGVGNSNEVIHDIEVFNTAPIADAGDSTFLSRAGDVVYLDASGSIDPDVTNSDQMLSFKWTQVTTPVLDTGEVPKNPAEGGVVALANSSQVRASFIAPRLKNNQKSQRLGFHVQVSDPFVATRQAPLQAFVDDDQDIVFAEIQNTPPLFDFNISRLMSDSLTTVSGKKTSIFAEIRDPDDQTLQINWSDPSFGTLTTNGALAEFTAPLLADFEASRVTSINVTVDDTVDTSTKSLSVELVNSPPVADAGTDRLVYPSFLTLDGSASSDIDAQTLSYSWQQMSGPNVTILNGQTATPSFQTPMLSMGDEPIFLEFSLVVGDTITSHEDRVVVVVQAPKNKIPIGDAGDNQSVPSGSSVILDGRGSSDADGQDLGYLWTQISGPSVVLSDATSVRPTFTSPLLGIGDEAASLIFSLVVNDGFESSLADEVTVTVNAPANSRPLSDAGDNQTVPSGSPVILDGRGSSDADGQDLGYLWTQISGPSVEISNVYQPRPSFVSPYLQPGEQPIEIIFGLTVHDGFEDSSLSTVTITVQSPSNTVPIADAGIDQIVTSGALVSLDGSGSEDFDGQDLIYNWSQVSGVDVTLSDTQLANPQFTAPILNIGDLPATFVFALRVSDGFDESEPTFTTVQVTAPSNSEPFAYAGQNQIVTSGSSVALDGGGSSDVDGQDLSYLWTQISGTSVVLSDARSVSPIFTAPTLDVLDAEVVLEFGLTVSDGFSRSGLDRVLVTITPPENNIPMADAGRSQLVLSQTVVSLDGTNSSDADNNPLTYQWNQLAGPVVALSDATSPKPSFSAPLVQPGQSGVVLEFGLVVNDGFVDSLVDKVVVAVQSQFTPIPFADAGSNQLIQSGSLVQLDGSNSYVFGNEQASKTYIWTQVSGPTVTLLGNQDVKPTFVAPILAVGQDDVTMGFRLVVDDGTRQSAADDVEITVQAPENKIPIADAGIDQIVASGELISLDATRSQDPDGHSLTYIWSQIGGPNVDLSDSSSARPSFVTPTLNFGDLDQELLFGLFVNDGFDQSSLSMVRVKVKAPVAKRPIADAGPDMLVKNSEKVLLSASDSRLGSGPGPLTYLWTQISGPGVMLNDVTSQVPVFTAPSLMPSSPQVILRFELRVSDGLTTSTPDLVTVTVRAADNNKPVADAGDSQSVSSNALVFLDGTASKDRDGHALSYHWTQISGEDVILSDAEAARLNFKAPTLDVGDDPVELTFELVVFDGFIQSAPNQTKVTVLPPLNRLPIADAGQNQTVEMGTVVTLDGTESFDRDGQDLSYNWSQVSGSHVVLSDHTLAQPTFTAPMLTADQQDQEVVFRLVVNDGVGDSGQSFVVVTVQGSSTTNQMPVADPGLSIIANSGALISLDGSASFGFGQEALLYNWSQISGPTVVLSNPSSDKPTFVAPSLKRDESNESILFSLVVQDELGSSEPKFVDVTVVAPRNRVPIADAGVNKTTISGYSIVLDGSRSTDADGDVLTYNWEQVLGADVSLSNPKSATPIFETPVLHIGDLNQTFAFDLTVDDGFELSQPSRVFVTVEAPQNMIPFADAGADQRVVSGSTVVLTGGNSYDPNGQALRFHWQQLSGPLVDLSDESAVQPIFKAPDIDVGLSHQTLVFSLFVHDGLAASVADTIVITVEPANAPERPLADAGRDLMVDSNIVVELNGTRSQPQGDTPLQFTWTQVAGKAVNLLDPSSARPRFRSMKLSIGDDVEDLQFKLIVDDGLMESYPSFVRVSVHPPKNTIPIADAGVDRAIQSGETVFLTALGSSDADGQGLSYNWTQVTGTPVQLSDPQSAEPSFVAPFLNVHNTPETLVFSVAVSDGYAVSEPDFVSLTVVSPPEENAPIAHAGESQDVDAGSLVMLDGSASRDATGQPLTYEWKQVSGTSVKLLNASTAKPNFVAPVLDVGDSSSLLVFSLTVNNGRSVSLADQVQVTVHAPLNTKPMAQAGEDITVASASTVKLDGSASFDNDGQALRFYWQQVGGETVTLSGSSDIQPSFLSPTLNIGAAAKVLSFSLIVNDGIEDSIADLVQVTVVAPQNTVPLADAGMDQVVRSGSFVTLDGAGSSDADAHMLTYKWTQTSGPTVELSDSTVAQPTFLAPMLDIYQANIEVEFSLVVHDGYDMSEPANVRITIEAPTNDPPIPHAGINQVVKAGSQVILDGSASADAQGDLIMYRWRQIDGMNVTLSDDTSMQPHFMAPMVSNPQVMHFALKTFDDFHAEDDVEQEDVVAVTVLPKALYPQIIPIQDQTSLLNQKVSYGVRMSKDVTLPVVFTADNLPVGLQLHNLTGLISGIPTELGERKVTITATIDNYSADVTFLWTVIELPDPREDPILRSTLKAMGDMTIRSAKRGFELLDARLDTLLTLDATSRDNISAQGVKFAFVDPTIQDMVNQTGILSSMQFRDKSLLPEGWAVWTEGTITYGQRDGDRIDNNMRFSTNAIGLGADYRINSEALIGVSAQYVTDETRVGGYQGVVDFTGHYANLYGSYQVGEAQYFQGVLGYGALKMDMSRFSEGSIFTASRSGDQLQGLLRFTYHQALDEFLLKPYGEIKHVNASLGSYDERGGLGAFHVYKQNIRSTVFGVGLGVDRTIDFGSNQLILGVDLSFDKNVESQDDPHVHYHVAPLNVFSFNEEENAAMQLAGGVGIRYVHEDGVSWRLGYEYMRRGEYEEAHNLKVGLGISF